METQAIPQDTFLLVSINLLHRAFVEATRTEAKKAFKELVAGEVVELATVELEDASTARFSLALEHSEFCGKLSFRGFRASVIALIGNITQALKDKKELRVFSAQQGSTAMIFGVTAVTVEAETRNIMVLAAEPGAQDDITRLQLMYLDPGQFGG